MNKTYTNIEHKFCRISPLGITPVKKAQMVIVDHSVDLSIPDFKKVYKKEWTEAMKNNKILHKCIIANTSAIWQYAAHTHH